MIYRNSGSKWARRGALRTLQASPLSSTDFFVSGGQPFVPEGASRGFKADRMPSPVLKRKTTASVPLLAADRRLQRVLTADPGTGVMRHADAGYDLAIETANERGVDLPMVNG